MENKINSGNTNKVLIGVGIVVAVIAVIFLVKGRFAKAPTEEVEDTTQQTSEETVNPNRREFVVTPVSVIGENTPLAEAVKNATKAPVNFNEHYVVVMVSCGEGCGRPYLFNKTTNNLFALNGVMTEGALGFEQIPNVIDVQTSPTTNVVTFRKKDTDGTEYFNQWRLYNDVLFVEVIRR